jgi:hypothetical protein
VVDQSTIRNSETDLHHVFVIFHIYCLKFAGGERRIWWVSLQWGETKGTITNF